MFDFIRKKFINLGYLNLKNEMKYLICVKLIDLYL